MQYIVTNFAYGTGPYIRTTELAIRVNAELEKQGKERLGILVPWVYGDKQRGIMFEEEFKAHEEKYPGEIVLDATLGELLSSIFYGKGLTYAEALEKWSASAEEVGKQIHDHLKAGVAAVRYDGTEVSIAADDIVMEINRSPRVAYNIAPTYSTTFGHIAEILEASKSVSRDVIDVDPGLLEAGVKTAKAIESTHTFCPVAYPATFTYTGDWQPYYGHEKLVPPITSQAVVETDEPLENGIFVTVTGIPGLERLYEEANELGLKLYSNDTEAVPGSEKQLPSVISNKAIQLQFARSGWGSVWYSMILEKPIVVPDFDPTDDPEIYWNNVAVEQMGIGIIYRGQPLKEIMADCDRVRENCRNMKKEIMDRWGTLDGHDVAARLIVERHLEN